MRIKKAFIGSVLGQGIVYTSNEIVYRLTNGEVDTALRNIGLPTQFVFATLLATTTGIGLSLYLGIKKDRLNKMDELTVGFTASLHKVYEDYLRNRVRKSPSPYWSKMLENWLTGYRRINFNVETRRGPQDKDYASVKEDLVVKFEKDAPKVAKRIRDHVEYELPSNAGAPDELLVAIDLSNATTAKLLLKDGENMARSFLWRKSIGKIPKIRRRVAENIAIMHQVYDVSMENLAYWLRNSYTSTLPSRADNIQEGIQIADWLFNDRDLLEQTLSEAEKIKPCGRGGE